MFRPNPTGPSPGWPWQPKNREAKRVTVRKRTGKANVKAPADYPFLQKNQESSLQSSAHPKILLRLDSGTEPQQFKSVVRDEQRKSTLALSCKSLICPSSD